MAENENPTPRREKAPKTHKALAESELKRATRLLKKNGDDALSNAQMVSVLLQQANVHATLELADTIRASNSIGGDA
jgi:hypothetical protein